MAAEIDEITESNQPDIETQFRHVITDLHEALKMLRDQGLILDRHDKLLEEFRPLLDQFRSPAATYMTRRTQKRSRYASKDQAQGPQVPGVSWGISVGQGHYEIQGKPPGQPTPRD